MIRGIHHISMKCEKADDLERVKLFYCELLGLKVKREWPAGIMLDTGSGLLEIFKSGGNGGVLGTIRHVALASDDVDRDIARVRDAGFEVFKEPNDLVIPSDPPFPVRMAFCFGPLGEQVELFQER